ncbi:Importin-5 [Amphibalanus amphitrite]|uniref:Importin-5 n=1 Tax=Amphibalanus amphitrite TaxID=1232801 RepID=A0A6A4WMW9_AMPAM|nr:importin-5-like [Amphibalanus amphitrite]KAF0306609.1 Importin-5 [Amphibalanus amphitrite]
MGMADDAQFQQILGGLLSEENEIRTQAESTYEQIALPQKISLLLGCLLNAAAGEKYREMSAVLLRRLLFAKWEEFYPNLPVEAQTQLKEQLLSAILQEQSESIRKKMCEVAAEMARNLFDDDGNSLWPEFLSFLFECASSQNAQQRECALLLFSYVPGVFGNQQKRYLEVIKNMLQQSLSDASSYKCRFLAYKATAQFIVDNAELSTDKPDVKENYKDIQRTFSELLPPMVQVLQESIAKGEDNVLLQTTITLAEMAPKLLRPQLDAIMQLCMKLMSDPNQEDDWRQLGMEIIVTLAEEASAMFRKHCAGYLPLLVPEMLKMMSEIEEDDDWATNDDSADDDSDSNYIVAESDLDRLAFGLGGKVMTNLILSNVQQLLVSADWKHRHAALSAVSTIGEGCRKQMEPLLPPIISGVVNFLKDVHPRVRHAACTCLGQMSEDFGPAFQRKFHAQVVPGLLCALEDSSNPRVQAQAALALINFSGKCPKAILITYLDAIFPILERIMQAKLKELVEKGTKMVLENVITTIASVAGTAEEKFLVYYNRFMPCLKYIIENATTQELRLLRGKAIECVSLIGLAVGKEKFLPDAASVMDLLLKAQTSGEEFATDDPQVPYLVSAWARMCTIMGKQFAVYLPLVMGPVMQMASAKPEWALLSDEDREVLNGDQEWELHNFGENQNFAVRTSVLEDKSTACAMLVCYARELDEEFAEYTQQVAELMTRLLKFYFHEGVRVSAAEIMPFLLQSGAAKGTEYVQQMWSFIVPELLQALKLEPNVSVIPEHMQSLAKCIETLNCPCLTDEQMRELFTIFNEQFEKHFEKSSERDEKRRDEDYDEEVEEELIDEDDEYTFIISRIADVLHSLFSVYRDQLFPLFDSIVPHLVKLMGPERAWTERQWSLCIWDDVIEFCSPASIKYSQYFLQPMVQYITDPQPEVCQAAAYGCGVLGQCGGPEYSKVCAEAIPRLVEAIQRPDSRSPEWISPTENAISAVTKILKYNAADINVADVIPVWFSWLPVWQDSDEVPYVYNYLCDLVEANQPAVLGPNNMNLPRIIAVIAEAFARNAVEAGDPTGVRLLNLVKQIQGNTELFTACLSQLSDQQREALHEALVTPPAAAQ